jgi:hypothetical protein
LTRLYQFHPFPRREPMRKTIEVAVVAALAASAGGMPPTGEDGNLAANQIGYQRQQPTVRPAVFDCRILFLDIAGFLQSLVECSGKGAGRPRVEMPNHRQCRLLCTCGERPSGRTAEHTEKLAPFSSSLSSKRRHCTDKDDHSGTGRNSPRDSFLRDWLMSQMGQNENPSPPTA